MGTLGRKPLERASDASVHRMFQPHKEYPLRQIGHELSKLPRETVGNFVDLASLMGKLKQVPAIRELLSRHPFLEKRFEQTVWDAVRERGIKAQKYWRSAPRAYIDAIVRAGRGKPNAMNTLVGRIAKRFFGNSVRERTILDIGTFAGGTITATVQALSPTQRKTLRVILVDVNGEVVRKHAVPALLKLGVPKQNIVVLPTSFYNAAVAFKQMPRPLHERGERRYSKELRALRGNVDLVTAGASTINFANDLKPLLQSIKKLLKPGGMFVDWEWGSAEAREPTVDIAELKRTLLRRGRGRKAITEFDAYVSFLGFWMGFFNYPESVKQRLFQDLEKSKKFNFVGWCEKNVEWMESERKKARLPPLPDPAGFRNRAYRDGRAMYKAAITHGFEATQPKYPFAQAGEKTTGNVNWIITMRKPLGSAK
jgi:SAM-dependent methyltransferase